MELSHQAVRALQYVQMSGSTTIQQISSHLGCAQNTASEIVRRLRQKKLLEKHRRSDDERVALKPRNQVGQTPCCVGY
ncbi:MarR family transcriptional regulator [Alicyclobacillus tolerans]|uniref:MarR family transcriptional regulator n=1 Tax=Alicyclobacillus tolerans TaxID=90970 RepID=UPI00351C7874